MSSTESVSTQPPTSDDAPSDEAETEAEAVEILDETAAAARDDEAEHLADAAAKVGEAEALDAIAHAEAGTAVELEAEADELEAAADQAHTISETAAAEGDTETADAAQELETVLRAEGEILHEEAGELATLAVETEVAAVDAAAEAVDDVAVAELDEAIAEAADEVRDEIQDAQQDEVQDEDALLQESVVEERPPDSPWNRPGRWFVVHTQSGYEKKVKQNLEARISSMNMEERIYEVVIPMEDVVEFKGGKKVVVQKKMFPGYLLVRCAMDDDSWYVIRNTPGVTGFVGQGAKPSPLPRRDVESFLQVKAADDETGDVARRGRARHEYEMGETVRIKEGPFADFSGQITEINEDQLKVKVEVDIFGRPTPVELEFSQIAKL